MMRSEYERRGGWSWITQVISGLLLIVLVGLHMIAQHFIVEGWLRTYQDVLAYVSNPVIFTLEILFLVVVTYHALLGVRSVLFDLGLSEAQERRVTQILVVIGLLTIGYGVWLSLYLIGQA